MQMVVEGQWTDVSEQQRDEILARLAQRELEAEIRSERDNRLCDCDWTQLPDAKADRQAWAIYRQALRDITTQEGFPHEVAWPSMPGQEG